MSIFIEFCNEALILVKKSYIFCFQEEEQDPMDEDEEQLDYEAEFNGD